MPCRVLSLIALVLALASAAHADSMWARASGRYGYLFVDNKARNIGDILTVLISETSAIGQREQRQLSKATDASEQFQFSGSSSSDNAQRTGAASLNIQNESNRQFTGNAQFNSNRQFIDRMAVTVIDILPNGNLVIEGTRVRLIAGERRIMRITGVVRPAELTPGNAIASEAIANFRIEYLGRGVETNWTTQGWLGRALNILWPF